MRSSSKLAIGIVAFAVAACGPYALTSAERDTAELGALKWATSAGMTFMSCSGQDSDGDNYVTCSAQTSGKIQELLCSYKTPGCKIK